VDACFVQYAKKISYRKRKDKKLCREIETEKKEEEELWCVGIDFK
jgi:hypothetical protein